MATQHLQIFQSQLEGSSISITYDDTTMLASGLTATCSQNAASALHVTYFLPAPGTGLANATPPAQPSAFSAGPQVNWSVTKGSAIATTQFAEALQGYVDPASGDPVFPFTRGGAHDGAMANAVGNAV